ncbi:uncharacterized protein LOC128229754 [Mya arenaria]|uniref:uncharacterized protein LOC128229754 n=1 Tax=Mya arenaria TaxID=6604 RepID=UPI0022DF5A26|nr:uncharacterized protein LOC128229754 [Mya arenaria]
MADTIRCGKEDKYADRLPKRLCYILRYGAVKEGLTVHEGGYVDIKDVMSVGMMRHHSEPEVLAEVETSLSHRKTLRFERKDEVGRTLVRAQFGRNFESSPFHEGTQVRSLLQTTLEYITDNLQDYDLQDFPDEFLLSKMISQLKRKKKLNSKNFKALLVPALEHLDVSQDVCLTQSMLKTMWSNCPNLRVLILKDCGYIVTDSVVETLFMKLHKLESVSLAACKHVTDKGVRSMIKYGANLQELNLSFIRTFSDSAIVDLVCNCERLRHLDIYDVTLGKESRAVIIEAARQRGVKVVLKGILESDPDVTLENPSMMLPNFGKTW